MWRKYGVAVWSAAAVGDTTVGDVIKSAFYHVLASDALTAQDLAIEHFRKVVYKKRGAVGSFISHQLSENPDYSLEQKQP